MNSLGLKLLARLEKEFADSKSRSLRGTIRARLTQLRFPNPFRDIDQKNVAILKRNFETEGCLQHDRECSVPATIEATVFRRVLQKLSVDAETFKTTSASYPAHYVLPGDTQLSCLHGKHRIVAASEFLPPGDRWWLVDIYDDGQSLPDSGL